MYENKYWIKNMHGILLNFEEFQFVHFALQFGIWKLMVLSYWIFSKQIARHSCSSTFTESKNAADFDLNLTVRIAIHIFDSFNLRKRCLSWNYCAIFKLKKAIDSKNKNKWNDLILILINKTRNNKNWYGIITEIPMHLYQSN